MILVSSLLLLNFYICYLIFFFSSEDFKVSNEAISLAELQTMWRQGTEQCPYIGLTGTGTRHETKFSGNKPRVQTRSCFTNEFQMMSDNYCGDETALPDIAFAEVIPDSGYRVYTDVSFVLSGDPSQKAIDKAVEDGMVCMNGMSGVEDPRVLVAAGYPERKKVILVTNDGKLPTALGKSRGIAAGVLFSGIVYSYRASMTPILRQVIAKTNVTVAYTPSSSTEICDVMGPCP